MVSWESKKILTLARHVALELRIWSCHCTELPAWSILLRAQPLALVGMSKPQSHSCVNLLKSRTLSFLAQVHAGKNCQSTEICLGSSCL